MYTEHAVSNANSKVVQHRVAAVTIILKVDFLGFRLSGGLLDICKVFRVSIVYLILRYTFGDIVPT